MPCDTIQRSKVDFNLHCTDHHLLKLALEGQGYKVSPFQNGLKFTNGYDVDGQFLNGKLTVQSRGQFDINALKRTYSAEVVKSSADLFGWTLQETSPGVFEAQKGF